MDANHLMDETGTFLLTDKHNHERPVVGAKYAHYGCGSTTSVARWGWYVRSDIHPNLVRGKCEVCGKAFRVIGRTEPAVEHFL